MRLTAHPLWGAGFRPFFTLACLAGSVLPAAWIAIYAGWIGTARSTVSIVQWHAHEMLFGFGWAVLGGFLLTATKNWVQIRGYHGGALLFLACAWLLERLGMAFAASLPAPLFWLSNFLFLVSIVAMLMWTLVRHRANDNFRDNYFFLLALPLFLIAKALLLEQEHFQQGIDMSLALYRLAFLIMFERTLTQFMKNTFQAAILRNPRLDWSIKALALILVFASFMPPALATGLDLTLAALLAWRFAHWQPRLAFGKLEIGIMYLGYLGIVAQLVIAAADRSGLSHWVGSLSAHAFSFGVMGLVMPAMIVRIANGHTGRPVKFAPRDKLVLFLMIAALVLRVLLPQLAPATYLACLILAAACWSLAFALLAWRCLPYLFAPRVDGKQG